MGREGANCPKKREVEIGRNRGGEIEPSINCKRGSKSMGPMMGKGWVKEWGKGGGGSRA